MRKILFRGKRIDNGEWVYGSGFITPIIGGTENGTRIYLIHHFCVDRESITEFTGLTDFNGNEIFEGDIIHAKYKVGEYALPSNIAEVNYIIVWAGSLCGFKAKAISEHNLGDGFKFLDELLSNTDECEIIGNVYDNPELMKGEQK